MPPEPDITDPAEAMLARLAGLDLSLAEHVHACAMATDDPHEVAELSRAYQRIARSVRQSLALHARMQREREKAEREDRASAERAARARTETRRAQVQACVERLIWTEYEGEEAEAFIAELDERLDEDVLDDGFLNHTIEAHIERFAREFGLTADPEPQRGAEPPDPAPSLRPSAVSAVESNGATRRPEPARESSA